MDVDQDVNTFHIGTIVSLTALAAIASAVTGGPITPATAAPRKAPQFLTSRLSAALEVWSSCLAAISGGLHNEANILTAIANIFLWLAARSQVCCWLAIGGTDCIPEHVYELGQSADQGMANL